MIGSFLSTTCAISADANLASGARRAQAATRRPVAIDTGP
jgi:hypothetical protein